MVRPPRVELRVMGMSLHMEPQNRMEGASNFRGEERQLSDTPARLHSLGSQSKMKSDLPRRELSENGHRGPYASSHLGHFGTGASTDAKHAKPEWKSENPGTLEPEPFTAAWRILPREVLDARCDHCPGTRSTPAIFGATHEATHFGNFWYLGCTNGICSAPFHHTATVLVLRTF
jgi:hypothetical protein